MNMLRGLLLLPIIAILSSGEPRVSIRVLNPIVQENGPLTIQCTVEPNEANRTLFVGIEHFRYSEMGLDGLRGPRTTQITYPSVPCGVEVAYCGVKAVGDDKAIARYNIRVVCGV